jgi:hypothetical protein
MLSGFDRSSEQSGLALVLEPIAFTICTQRQWRGRRRRLLVASEDQPAGGPRPDDLSSG